jgi:integrase
MSIRRNRGRCLTELERLLRQPDRRTTIGVRDRALLEILARAGLRRAELARLTIADIQERGRQPDARRRTAIAPRRVEQIRLEVVVRSSKRGRTRTVPLHAEAHDGARAVVRLTSDVGERRLVRQPRSSANSLATSTCARHRSTSTSATSARPKASQHLNAQVIR